MAQDRFSEGGRGIVWKAVMDSLNAHRRRGVFTSGTYLKFESWRAPFDDWKPGDPDPGGLEEEDIQTFIADIAADVCKRVEEALDAIDPQRETRGESRPKLSAAERAKKAWKKAWRPVDMGDVLEGRVPTEDVKSGLEDELEDGRPADVFQSGMKIIHHDIFRTMGRPPDPPAAVDEVPDVPPLADQIPKLDPNTVTTGGTYCGPAAPLDHADPEKIQEMLEAVEDGAEALGPVSEAPRAGRFPGRAPRKRFHRKDHIDASGRLILGSDDDDQSDP